MAIYRQLETIAGGSDYFWLADQPPGTFEKSARDREITSIPRPMDYRARKGHLKTDCGFSLFRWDTARTETVHENSTHSLREVDFWHSGGFVLGC